MEKKNEKYEQKGIAMTCRSFQEYMDMFALEHEDLEDNIILDVASGASSFVSSCNEQGYTAYAIDPLFAYDAEALKGHGLQEIEKATDNLKQAKQLFNWDYYGSFENHQDHRKQSLSMFIEDFQVHKNKRYKKGMLPNLPFEDNQFSLILSSHFLFLYEEQFDVDFHYEALKELLRICKKGGFVRIYPLVGFDGKRYKKMQLLEEKLLAETGVSIAYIPTTFNFMENASEILQLYKK